MRIFLPAKKEIRMKTGLEIKGNWEHGGTLSPSRQYQPWKFTQIFDFPESSLPFEDMARSRRWPVRGDGVYEYYGFNESYGSFPHLFI